MCPTGRATRPLRLTKIWAVVIVPLGSLGARNENLAARSYLFALLMMELTQGD